MTGTDRIADPWGQRTPYSSGHPWPTRVDTHLEPGADPDRVRWVRSASLLHSNGDAFDHAVQDGRVVGVRGRAEDRVNRGRLGPKDLYGWQGVRSADRLTRPLVRDAAGELVETDWDTAMDRIVTETRRLLAGPGPSSIGFYTSGQLFAEEYATLAAIGHGAIGTNHMDGNTRLCTATAAAALKESFGADGQPGSYADIDHADVIALFGHNVAATQTVLWSRMLDRLAGDDPPRLLCVDPRDTPVARAARESGGIHLAPRPGTNLALMNGLLHEIVAHGWLDHTYVDTHTVGYDALAALVARYPPERVAGICGIDPAQIRDAARLLGRADRLLSTVLQGFYQSHQATASAVAVNDLHLLRGMLGRPGCGVLQMNGQPSAQNTRECGADGDLAGFRNWHNPAHVRELAAHWNLHPDGIPHSGPPTHAMKIFDLVEQGSIELLWVTATNPAVSLPDLHRIRSVLARPFLVVQDLYRTETTEFADVVLPAATAGEKTGCLTNADRTVHLSDKAVEPPGEARPDLDILLDFARRMDFRDLDGAPFPAWTDAASAFDAWAASTAGRPCDYTGLSHAVLRDRASGVQWPCPPERPDGTERLYRDGRFPAHPDHCEDFGHDLASGTPVEPDAYRAYNPDGRAMLKATDYLPARESPDHAHPFALITGRTIYHFHTRTKTGRTPQLQAAAPQVWVECAATDARRLGLAPDDMVEVTGARGTVRGRLRVTEIREGVLFVPFHYGYWDAPDRPHDRAANELTPTDWDPVSKQPLFKVSAAALRRAPEPVEARH